jgi:3D (Asp-Asp-Asp) domain-containing protein
MIISGCIWRKAVVTAVAVGGFMSLYEVTTLDSRYAARQAVLRETVALPSPGARLAFSATAYCKGATTTSGVTPQSGVAAADPTLLPVGTVVEIDGLPKTYNGIYTVMDTGPAVQGRELDLYMWSCNDALKFGRQSVHITVLRLGWNPHETMPSFIDRIFRRPTAQTRTEPSPAPPRPLPSSDPN